MGLFRTATRLAARNSHKIKQAAEDNADKINDNVRKVTKAIDDKTGGKHRDKLDKVEGAVKKAVDKNDGPDPTGDYPTDRPNHPDDPPGPTPPTT